MWEGNKSQAGSLESIILDGAMGERLEDIEHGNRNSSSVSLTNCVERYISERESKRFEEGLSNKVKLDIYIYVYINSLVREVNFCLSLDRVHMV